MKIIVDCCNYFLDNHNIGDMAIYQVVVMRLRHFWPDAEINWVTLDSQIIRKIIPEVRPLVLQRPFHWELHLMKEGLGLLTTQFEKIRSLVLKKLKINLLDPSRMEAINKKRRLKIMKKMRSANLVVVLGGGAFSDQFSDHAMGLLETLAGGVALGKVSILMSSGFELISNAQLIEKSKIIIPKLPLVFCREPETSPKILTSFGLAENKIRVTGDDAVELAYKLRVNESGRDLGFNIRVSNYSGINNATIKSIRRVLHEAGKKHKAALLGLPISLYGPSDNEGIKTIIDGYDGSYDLGARLKTPEAVIRQVGKCRVIVSGSYHSSVFALAQGIPVVAIATSLHYLTKFSGLMAQFPGGCAIVNPEEPDFEKKLSEKINVAWKKSIKLKPTLLDCAKDQIKQSWAAYQHLYEIAG